MRMHCIIIGFKAYSCRGRNLMVAVIKYRTPLYTVASYAQGDIPGP
jgi:hypothetical protein